MPRQIRIEYENAFYHVMARGNRRGPIFVSPDREDEALFIKTLGETCERTGFEIWAWVLMGNHYHLVLKTPKANLVEGMTWLQNTYTRRFNVRHREWGRLFGDRYKAVLVEGGGPGSIGGSYLSTLLDYVHLNPVRAGLIKTNQGESLLEFPGSSIADGYAVPSRKRPQWLDVAGGLQLLGFDDTPKGRRNFIERLEQRAIAENSEFCGDIEMTGQSLNSTLRRGWVWGSDAFKEGILERLEDLRITEESVSSDREGRDAAHRADHHARDAEKILSSAVSFFSLKNMDALQSLPRGDLRGIAVAWAICRKTSMPQKWIADRLGLRSGANVSQRVRNFDRKSMKELDPLIRKWKREYKI